MRKIVIGAFTSLDGVMQAPGGPDEDPTGGFKHGGWIVSYSDETTGAAVDETFSTPFDLLLGRKTYDIFAAHWPRFESSVGNADALEIDIARKFNAATKYVATHSPETLTWQNSEPLGSDVVRALRDLKGQDGPTLLVQGSSELIKSLLANDLVDELRLLIYPLVLGKGKRLFDASAMPRAFRLSKSVTSANGAVIANYERAGEVATGSFALEKPTEAEIERRKKLT